MATWSPNSSSRKGTVIDTIVLHSTAGSASGAIAWFMNPNSRVSAHYVVAKDGKVTKLVPTSLSAWHAGRLARLKRANMRSIGIEMEQLTTDLDWTPEQYKALDELITKLRVSIPTIKFLVGHREINAVKSDPYHIDMDELRKRFQLAFPDKSRWRDG